MRVNALFAARQHDGAQHVVPLDHVAPGGSEPWHIQVEAIELHVHVRRDGPEVQDTTPSDPVGALNIRERERLMEVVSIRRIEGRAPVAAVEGELTVELCCRNHTSRSCLCTARSSRSSGVMAPRGAETSS